MSALDGISKSCLFRRSNQARDYARKDDTRRKSMAMRSYTRAVAKMSPSRLEKLINGHETFQSLPVLSER